MWISFKHSFGSACPGRQNSQKTWDAIEIHIISLSCVVYSLDSLGSLLVSRDQHKPAFLCCKNEANKPAIVLIEKIVFLSFYVCA